MTKYESRRLVQSNARNSISDRNRHALRDSKHTKNIDTKNSSKTKYLGVIE